MAFGPPSGGFCATHMDLSLGLLVTSSIMRDSRFFVRVIAVVLFMTMIMLPATTNAKTLSNKEMQNAIILLQKQVAELQLEVQILRKGKTVVPSTQAPAPVVVPQKPPKGFTCPRKSASVPMLSDGKWVCGSKGGTQA